MTSMTSVAPVHREVVVHASAEHAFKVFTEGLDKWWPRQHHIGATPLKEAKLEPKAGGRWYAVHEDGTESDTGEVLVWDPPRRVVLSWRITAEWKFDPTFHTEVEVTFTPQGPKQTLVVLEHQKLDAYGPAAPAVREQIDSAGGWGIIMEQFAAIANG